MPFCDGIFCHSLSLYSSCCVSFDKCHIWKLYYISNVRLHYMHKMHKKQLGNQCPFDASHECDIRDDTLLCLSTMLKLQSSTTAPTTTMSSMHKGCKQMISTMSILLQLWYRLLLYSYLIHWTGTFIFLYSNLAMPLFPNSMPLFHIHLQMYLFLLMTCLYSDIYDAFIISTYDLSLSLNTYNLCTQ